MRYDPASDHEPLFAKPTPAQGGGSEMKSRSIPSVAQAKCPQCANAGTTGLVPQGPHLVWRLHTRRTIGGVALECQASGMPVCQVAPKPLTGVTTPVCTCTERRL